MSKKDRFENERQRVERVLEILESIATRLDARGQVAIGLVGDAVEFVRASEDAAYEASQTNEDEPALSACIEQHDAARLPLRGMQQALRGMQLGESAASDRFAHFAREYVRLRRDHMRLDDRLFTSAMQPAGAGASETTEQSPSVRDVYDRLLKASSALTAAVLSGAPSGA